MTLAHPLHAIDNRSRNKRRNLWVGWCVSSWWPWFPYRCSVLIYIYIYIYSLYEFCYRTFICIQRECHSVLAKLHPITFYGIVFLGSARFLGWMPPFFLWFTNCVLLFDKSLILGCLWPLVFVLNNTLILGIWCSTIPHLPGCFCPCFWKWNFKQQLGCRFDIKDNISYFCVFWHKQFYIFWNSRSFFGFTFLNILCFVKYCCTNNIFDRRGLYTFYQRGPWIFNRDFQVSYNAN